ncbi:MAG: sulfite exporter TauE/SafE family protein [Bradyrhizobiaceae bacterium]|nr:sulfite exporter TauE/SafE family protein [Bradyrhizobiaceae bacterium]
MNDLSIPVALFAGLISFVSPCVLPLVPPYLCFLAGTTFEHVMAREPSALVARREVATAAVFVAGFSTVFVALGAGASVIGGLLRAYSDVLSIVAGVAIMAMGLHFLGLLPLHFLHNTKRMEVEQPVGLLGAYAMGLAFAFGWTPCIGPVLAAILAVAASEATVAKGAGLLAVYSLGLGIPFVLAAFAIGPFVKMLARVRGRLHLVEKVMGALLVLTGIAFLTGWISQASYWLLETFPVFQQIG